VEYPIVAGIPDFRVAPDPWIGLDEDRAKALRLEALTAGMGFEEAVRTYWQITPGTPRALAARFTDHVLRAEQRTREWLAQLPGAERLPAGPWLDLGCGTADLAAAAAGAPVVGIDIALRWLVIARKRLGLEASSRLVCCNAERLPFPDRSFARALSLGMLEHCSDEKPVLREAARVLRSGGTVHLRTTNRFAPLREPHVRVWGVGFVPRRWADAYVRLRSGSRYLHHRPLSRWELNRGLRDAGFAEVGGAPARLLATDRQRLGRLGRPAGSIYTALSHRCVTRSALASISPLIEAWGTRP
jgi:SAM-dependent methyltransferase